MIALLLAPLLALQEPAEPEFFARLRGGAWMSKGFQFDALSSLGRREVDGSVLATLGVGAGVCLDDRWLFSIGGEYAWAGDVRIRTLDLGAGCRLWRDEASPFRVEFSAGLLWGSFDVDQSGFGRFDAGVGARGGFDAILDLTEHLALGGAIDVRFLRFDYREDVLDGDTRAGGGGIAAGLVFDLRW